MSTLPETSFWAALWRALKRIDKSKVNSPFLALRNAIAVALPLAVAIELGNSLVGIAIATGALNVAYSDGRDPYAQRARRMLAWSFLGGVAVFLGSASGRYTPLALGVVALWGFGAGMLVSISTRAGDLGLNTLVTLIVYSARAALSPKGALYAGLLVLAGGLLQTVFALLFWPLRRNEPERRALAKVYAELGLQIDPAKPDVLATPLSPPTSDVQDVLSALGRDHSTEGERFRLLFDQADRLRMSIYALGRLRDQLAENHRADTPNDGEKKLADAICHLLAVAAKLLDCVSRSLSSGKTVSDQDRMLAELEDNVKQIQRSKLTSSANLGSEIAAAADVLGGQLRTMVAVTERSVDARSAELPGRQLAPSWTVQLKDWLGTIRANLYPGSAAFRHALRLSICVVIGDAIGRSLGVGRNYWLPMTVAVILKPDFTTTLSRGVLRLFGTFAGLLLATVLYHLVPPSGFSELLLVGVFTFILRYVGGGNYGIFSVAISGLIVFLISQTGIAPRDVIWERAINTAVGGIFALLAYALWPTWEKTQVSEAMAQMFDSARLYLQAVVRRFSSDDPAADHAVDEARQEWRRARSAAEASVDRLSSEPSINPSRIDTLTSMLASSHALVYSIFGLEAGATSGCLKDLPPELEKFAHDVEFTLYYVAAAMRGSTAATETLPKIREDHRRLLDARDRGAPIEEYVVLETDAMTVSLNTLREQVVRYIALPVR